VLILAAKHYKLSLLSSALFLFFILNNFDSLMESFRYNPDPFTNRLFLFSLVFVIVFASYIFEVIKRIQLHKKQLSDRENFLFMIDTTGDVLYRLNLPERTYSYISPSIEKLTGYNKEEINSIKIKNLVKRAEKFSDKNFIYSDFNPKGIISGNTFAAEYLLKTKDGKYKWIEDISVPRRDEQGKEIGSIGIMRDITERKNYFSMINEELNNVKRYLEIAEVMFLVLDKKQEITFVNKKACQLLGYKEEELIGKNWYDSFTPVKNREKRKKAFDEVFMGLYPAEEYQENLMLDRFGDEHIVGWHDAVIRDNRNNITAIISSGTDVTEQKLVEESLRFERYLLQTLLDNIPDGIFFKDRELRYIRTGKGFLTKEFSPAEINGKTDKDFFSREFAKQSYNEEQEILKTGTPVINKIEKQVFYNGSHKWASTTKMPIYDAGGNISGIVGISRDISELKKAEETIKENEQRWRNLLENSPISIIIISNRKIVYANSEAVKIAGAENAGQLLGKNIFDFTPAQNKYEFITLNRAVNSSGEKTPHTEGKIFNLKKEIIAVELAAMPVNYLGNESLQIIFKDISERKREEKVQQVINQILQTANSELNIEQLYLFIHNSIKALMNADNFYIALIDQSSETVAFPYYVDMYDSPPPPQKMSRGSTEYVIREGKSQLFTKDKFIALNESGEIKLMGTPCKVWMGVPLKIQDKTIGVMVVQDYENECAYNLKDLLLLETIAFPVSRAIERKIVEAEREELIKQLKDINLSKDALFSVISHDLRSPFNALLGLSDILSKDYQKLSEQDRNNYLKSINKTARNLFSLVNNLLEFSRFQTGKMDFAPVKINLKEAVEKNILLIEGNAVSKNIKIEHSLEDISLFADEAMFGSVIQNILSNAIKFSEPGKSIFITGQIIKQGAKNFTELRIKDQGVGMCEETLLNLFRPDKVVSTTGTAKEPGSGLGLLITKDYIEKNRGAIKVISEKNKGTEFIITLPAAD
jgi:PAS domain S-box-containing protein